MDFGSGQVLRLKKNTDSKIFPLYGTQLWPRIDPVTQRGYANGFEETGNNRMSKRRVQRQRGALSRQTAHFPQRETPMAGVFPRVRV